MNWRAVIGFELGWLALVYFQHLAMLPVAIYLLWAWWRLPKPRQILVLQLALLGIAIDSVLVFSGVLQFTSTIWLPAWFLLLWCLFALAVVEVFAALLKPLWLAPILGAVGGPLSYLGGAVLSGGQLLMPLGWVSWASLVLIWAGLAAYYGLLNKERLHAQKLA